MVAKQPGTDAPSADAPFTPEQESRLAALIAEAAGGTKPPPAEDKPAAAPPMTDDQWAALSDRGRQNYVAQLVDFRLDTLAKKDADAERDRKIAELEAAKGGVAEPERPPTLLTKLQAWLWGDQSSA